MLGGSFGAPTRLLPVGRHQCSLHLNWSKTTPFPQVPAGPSEIFSGGRKEEVRQLPRRPEPGTLPQRS